MVGILNGITGCCSKIGDPYSQPPYVSLPGAPECPVVPLLLSPS